MQRINVKIAKWLMLITAVLELAFSQVHIKAIIIMFERRLGFYLFLFILFGLLLVFLLSSMKSLDGSTIFKISATSLVASGTAFYCIMLMWKDYKANEVIKLEDFRISLFLMITGIAVYTLGSVDLVINSFFDGREAKP